MYHIGKTSCFTNDRFNFSSIHSWSANIIIHVNFILSYSDISGDAQALRNFHGLDTVFKIETIGPETVISGSITTGSVSEKIPQYWYTGSTQDWTIKNEKVTYHGNHAGDDSKLINYSGSIDILQDPPTVQGLETFAPNTTYEISFKLTDVEQTGSLSFQLNLVDFFFLEYLYVFIP